MAPPPATATAPPFAFQRGQIFSTNQATIMEQSEQDQQVGSQVRQFAIAPFILLPTAFEAGVIQRDPPFPARKKSGAGVLARVLRSPRALHPPPTTLPP